MLGKTPDELGIAKGTVVPPEGGWQEHTCYIVEVAWRSGNPIHRVILSVGFLNGRIPLGGSYTSFLCSYATDGEYFHPTLAYYIKAIAPIKGIGSLEKEL